MAKAIFHEGEVETVLEVPEHLVIINDLTEDLSRIELDKRKEYPKEKFMELWLNEEDDTPNSRGYDFLVQEITKLYCEHKQVDTNDYHCEFLRVSDDDIEKSISMAVVVHNYENDI